MVKTNISHSKDEHFTNSTFELVKWPSTLSSSLDDKVLALQTSRLSPELLLNSSSTSLLTEEVTSTFGGFNLGLHVGDNAERVTDNRNVLNHFISQQLFEQAEKIRAEQIEQVDIQWLEQVHGNEVVTITRVDEQAIVADASITRQKNIALAIMTADCLPILLSHEAGTEIAAIHGGWRPLAGNIVAKTIAKMHSKPSEIVAWLGPCIGKNSFEVGEEVKQTFTQLGEEFTNAFVMQDNGKYLADLHKIARLQLASVGVNAIASITKCTYQETETYYSYRKQQITGRMASVICRR
ncbi:MAG TPA: peptidoglycan editing factor PgeF [Colwellia sp.]|nr:peptidoglycan editing factor PgeF [Colwellia sp.]